MWVVGDSDDQEMVVPSFADGVQTLGRLVDSMTSEDGMILGHAGSPIPLPPSLTLVSRGAG